MLKEILSIAQIPGEPQRRWFADDYFDLIVWFDNNGTIVGFQLSYDKEHRQRAVTWKRSNGFAHNAVDDGESRPGHYKATPILVADGIFDSIQIAERFKREGTELAWGLAEFVYSKLLEFK